MSTRSTPPAEGWSPTGANEGLDGVLEAFARSPRFAAIMAAQHGFVRAAAGDLKATVTVDAPPGGWLLCDYALYDIQNFPELAAVLAKAGWEIPPYSPTPPPPGYFFVPDFRHVTMIGADPANGSGLGALNIADYGTGATTLAVANLPAHTHPPSSNNFMLTDGTAVTMTAGAGGYKYSTGFAAATGATGSGTAFTAMPPFTSVNIWIKT